MTTFLIIVQLLGDIPGAKRNAFLNTDDMFELGRHAYNLHDWSHSKEWMITALEQPDIEEDMKYNSMDYLSYAEYKVSCAVRWSSRIVVVCKPTVPSRLQCKAAGGKIVSIFFYPL